MLNLSSIRIVFFQRHLDYAQIEKPVGYRRVKDRAEVPLLCIVMCF